MNIVLRQPVAILAGGAVVALAVLASCNDPALCDNGRCDAVGSPRDAGILRDTGTGTSSDGTTADAAVGTQDAGMQDAGVLVIAVSRAFTSLNGATISTTDAGTQITGYSAAANDHPVIVPNPQPTIPSDDYTVIGTLFAMQNGEFGVLTRVRPDDNCVLFGSQSQDAGKPFLGDMSAPQWNPSLSAYGAFHTFVAGTHYKFKVQAVGAAVSAKLWDAAKAEPPIFDTKFSTTVTTGRGIGFYTYTINNAVVEDMVVTVP